MKKTKSKKYKISTIFSISIFFILAISIPLAILANNLIPFDLGFRGQPGFRLVMAVLIFATAGTIASKLISKNTINSIVEIKNATKEIANGNYNIRIEETSNLLELDDMAQNFNLMAQDLAASEIMKSDFINNVSHDFKTPLSAIEGYASLIKDKKITEDKIGEYADHILYNSKRLSQMTSNILLLSNLDNSRKSLNELEFSLDEQIREMVLLFEKEWNQKKLKLDIDLDKTVFCGDKELISHIWQNLISNAVKFCNKNGKIDIKLKNINDKIVVSISNTGSFIDKEDMSKIFEKFYQTNSSRNLKGNGLGLPIVKKVIDLYNGEIQVTSKENKQTTFTVSLNN